VKINLKLSTISIMTNYRIQRTNP